MHRTVLLVVFIFPENTTRITNLTSNPAMGGIGKPRTKIMLERGFDTLVKPSHYTARRNHTQK